MESPEPEPLSTTTTRGKSLEAILSEFGPIESLEFEPLLTEPP
jgi:hypothetical protein